MVAVRQRILAHERPAYLGLPLEDRVAESIALVEILFEQFGQAFHRQVFARAHEGELEEADDDRGQRDESLFVVIQVNDQTAASHVRDPVVQCFGRHSRALGQPFHRRRPGRDPRGKLGVFDAEQDSEDLDQGGGVGGAGDVLVQPLLQALVDRSRVDGVAHVGCLPG